MAISLKPMMYQHKPPKQFEMTQFLIWEIFDGFEASIITELTQEHNVHYHVMVELRDIAHKDRLLNRFRKFTKIFGKKSCVQVMFEESYKNYMKKCPKVTEGIIGHNPIVRDHFGFLGNLSIPFFDDTNHTLP